MSEPIDKIYSWLNLDDLGIPPGPEHECPYLDGQVARERAFLAESIPEGLFRRLMDHGWRRSGQVVYKTACPTCDQCKPIRIPVRDFTPGRTHRKLLKRNSDLTAEIQEPTATEEKFEFFRRYQKSRHRGDMCDEWVEFNRFLYESPVRSREFAFRLEGQLAAVAIVDFDEESMSSVYTWFDATDERRSLGTWAILWLAQYARSLGLRWYYLGYYIADCQKMNYKDRFRPCEIGDGRGKWRRLE